MIRAGSLKGLAFFIIMGKIVTLKVEEKTLLTENGCIPYTVYYKNVRNLSCKFDLKGSKLKVSAPYNYTDYKIESFLYKNIKLITKWIEKASQNDIKISREFLDGEQYLLLGNYYTLKINKVNNKKEEGIKIINNEIILNTCDLTNKDYKRKIIEKYYKNLAKRIISEEFQIIKNRYGEKIPNSYGYSLRIRRMKTLWGTNSLRTKKITINFNLIFAPIEDIEYVIIHELCHCAVRNHSKVFYSYQQMFCPEYKARKADLNKNIHPFVVKIEAINSTI